MNSKLPILPVIFPFLFALFSIYWRRPSVLRRTLAAVSFLVLLVLNLFIVKTAFQDGWLIHRMGDWQAPFGIVLSVDVFSALMLSLTSFVGLCCVLFGFSECAIKDENPLRLPLLFFLLAGINMSFVTGDLFNLYVAFEVMLLSSYALMTLEADNWHSKHAFTYVALNLFASTLFLIGAGLIYGKLGTLNYADIALKAAQFENDPLLILAAVLLTLVFSMKAGLFPLYYWLPKSYPTLPTPLAAFYGGLLTKVGIYALVRLFYTILPHSLTLPHQLVLWLSVPTMIFGVIGAVSKGFTRGILSYHIISQVGFIVLALGFFTPISLIACIFYITHHIIVKSSLFLAGGIGFILNKTDDLENAGGLWKASPLLGILFLFQALSLAGIPPLSGFWGKYIIILEGFRIKGYIFVAASLIASLLTIISMLKIWFAVFWKKANPESQNFSDPRKKFTSAVLAMMVMVSIFIGFNPTPVMNISQKAASQLENQKQYIDVVLFSESENQKEEH